MKVHVRISVRGSRPPLALEFPPKGDVVYVRLSDAGVARTVEVEDGALADYDADGRLVGLELLHLDDPRVIGTLERMRSRFAREAPQLACVEATAA